MNVIAAIEPVPESNTGEGGSTEQGRELSVEAASYEAGFAELRGQVPEGWRIINVRRDAY